jgi:hypothetical protein
MSSLQLASFRLEVTPPIGHPLCAGWVPPAAGIADPLYCGGVILLGDGAPVVLCAIDWCEISNRSYHLFQRKIADAVGTEPNRVAIHCMHPHCTPWPDEVAQSLVEARKIRPVMDAAWCHQTFERVAAAARHALSTPRPVTHVQTGRGKVEKVASNRRVMGEDGKVKAVRWTRTLDAAVRAEPEGEIDPWLKTISFWNEDEKLVALHYYAVHPSSYEDSFVTPDFTGLARERRIREDGGVLHLYFTECAGDITAGKYNDGARELREVFTERIHRAMVESEESTRRHALKSWRWSTHPVQLPAREDRDAESSQRALQDESLGSVDRCRAAFMLAYREREAIPVDIGVLHLNDDVCIVHLPGESFMEYQLFAQQRRPDAFVAVPSYGDCGPGYICLEKSFAEGGYEPTDSFVAGRSEAIMKNAIAEVLKSGSS